MGNAGTTGVGEAGGCAATLDATLGVCGLGGGYGLRVLVVLRTGSVELLREDAF